MSRNKNLPLNTEQMVYFIKPHNTIYLLRFQMSMFDFLKRSVNGMPLLNVFCVSRIWLL